jgi:hypothetical protein
MEPKAMAVTAHHHPAPVTPLSGLLTHAHTYHRFMLALKWSAIHLAALIAFLALWFCTDAGFFGGLVVGVLIFAAGVYAMNHGLNRSSEVETLDGALRAGEAAQPPSAPERS